jgi:hypothetical protein
MRKLRIDLEFFVEFCNIVTAMTHDIPRTFEASFEKAVF